MSAENLPSAVLFTALWDGDFDYVCILLAQLDARQLNTCLICENTTPMVVASRYGHLDIVKYLLARGADSSACGTVSFDEEVIREVSPLWAAAAAGHLEICKLLLDHGVCVNQTSSTNSTPLRGACYDGHLEIVKFLVIKGADIEIANRHGHTSLMVSCYRGKTDIVDYLLEIGAQVNRCSKKGNTALHDAAEVGHSQIIRKLIAAGAKMLADADGVTPLFAAAMHGQTEVLATLFAYATKREQRDAWKLLGATMVDRRNDLGFGVACWRTAFTANFPMPAENGDEPDLPAIDALPELNDAQCKIYGVYREVCSLQDVEQLIGDPEAIRMQAQIIRERILGSHHPETHLYLRLRGATFYDIGRWDQALDFWLYVLQLEQRCIPALTITTMSFFITFVDAFNAIVNLMIMENNRGFNPPIDKQITLERVIVVIERALYEAERYIFSDDEWEEEIYDDFDVNKEIKNLLNANRIYYLSTTREQRLKAIQRPIAAEPFINNINNYSAMALVANGNVSQNASSLALVLALAADFLPLSNSTVDFSDVLDFNRLNFVDESSSIMETPLRLLPPILARSPALVSPPDMRPNVRSLHRQQHNQEQLSPSNNNNVFDPFSYVFNTGYGVRFPYCRRAFIEPHNKISKSKANEEPVQLPLRPKCPHIRCLMHRVYGVFRLLNVHPLHVACEEYDYIYDVRQSHSSFVISKLLEAGADPRNIDMYDNTALHVLLKRKSPPSATVVKLLLDSGVPLLARNTFDETCLDLITKNAPSLIERLHIVRYLTLKQIAANVVMRNLSGKQTFDGILPRELEEFIAIF